MSELEVLKWAIGADADPPSRVDDDTLLYELDRHRLLFRFRDRLKQERLRCISTSLYLRLGKMCLLRSRRFERQLQAAQEAANIFREHGHRPPILFKGLSIYAITADPVHIPVSNDVDLFAEDWIFLTRKLQELGYAADISEDRHDAGVLEKGDLRLEVHSWFNCWAYPQGLRERFRGDDRFYRHLTTPDINSVHLELDDLLPYCQPGAAISTCGFLVPSPTLAVLLLCIHCFTNYVEPSYWRIRLSEIANIRDLIMRQDFSSSLFVELVQQFSATDSVRFALSMAARLYGQAPNQELGSLWPSERSECFDFPIRLTYSGGWAKPYVPDELANPMSSRPIPERLGAVSIIATTRTEGRWRYYSTVANSGESPPIKGLSFSLTQDESPLEIAFSAEWNDQGVLFHVLLPSLEEGSRCHYDVYGANEEGVPHGPNDQEALRSQPFPSKRPFEGASGQVFIARMEHVWNNDEPALCLLYAALVTQQDLRPKLTVFSLSVSRDRDSAKSTTVLNDVMIVV